MKEVIISAHECDWCRQNDPVKIVSIKGNDRPWTLRVTFEDWEDEWNIDIDFCPFCGENLSSPLKRYASEELPDTTKEEYDYYTSLPEKE